MIGVDFGDLPDTAPQITPGVELFNQLSPQEQMEILGPAKYAACKAGKFTLTDLVGRERSREWGTHRYEKSLAELGINARQYFVAPARRVFGYTGEEL